MILVSQDILCRDFSLSDKDAAINFDNLSYEIAEIDIQGRENAPRYKNLSEIQRELFLEHFKSLPDDSKINQCAETYAKKIFLSQVESRKIFAKDNFSLPTQISPPIF